MTTRNFTPRMREVVELTAKGMRSKDIARQLNISPVTVKIHLRNSMLLFKAKNQTDLCVLSGCLMPNPEWERMFL